MLQIRTSRQRNDMMTKALDMCLKQLLSLMSFFASPSFLTLKTNQPTENAFFFCHCCAQSFRPLSLLISFQPLLLFIYEFKINVSTQFLLQGDYLSFLPICRLCPTYSSVFTLQNFFILCCVSDIKLKSQTAFFST